MSLNPVPVPQNTDHHQSTSNDPTGAIWWSGLSDASRARCVATGIKQCARLGLPLHTYATCPHAMADLIRGVSIRDRSFALAVWGDARDYIARRDNISNPAWSTILGELRDLAGPSVMPDAFHACPVCCPNARDEQGRTLSDLIGYTAFGVLTALTFLLSVEDMLTYTLSDQIMWAVNGSESVPEQYQLVTRLARVMSIETIEALQQEDDEDAAHKRVRAAWLRLTTQQTVGSTN